MAKTKPKKKVELVQDTEIAAANEAISNNGIVQESEFPIFTEIRLKGASVMVGVTRDQMGQEMKVLSIVAPNGIAVITEMDWEGAKDVGEALQAETVDLVKKMHDNMKAAANAQDED